MLSKEFADYPSVHPNAVCSLTTFERLDTPQGREKVLAAISRIRQFMTPFLPTGLRCYWDLVYGEGEDLEQRLIKWSPEKDPEAERVLADNGWGFMLATNLGGMAGPWVVAGGIQPNRPGWPVSIQFSLDPLCFGPEREVPRIVQSSLAATFLDVARLVSACNGLVTLEPVAVDPLLYSSPFEQWMRLPLDYPIELDRWAKGYFWGNLLSSKHIEGLGGLERVLREAPFRCEQTPGPNGPSVYMQISEDINDYSDDDLRRLRGFLAPILPRSDARVTNLDRRFRLLYDD